MIPSDRSVVKLGEVGGGLIIACEQFRIIEP